MSLEIIERKTEANKQIIDRPFSQISLNDWGHLVIRFFGDDNKEQLVVFDKFTTNSLFRFVEQLIQRSKKIIRGDDC